MACPNYILIPVTWKKLAGVLLSNVNSRSSLASTMYISVHQHYGTVTDILLTCDDKISLITLLFICVDLHVALLVVFILFPSFFRRLQIFSSYCGRIEKRQGI